MAYQFGDPVFFRLLVPLPLRLEWVSATYDLDVSRMQFGSWMWTLDARIKARAQVVNVSEDFAEREWLEQALYQDGFATRYGTTGETILRTMTRLKQAAFLREPLRKPEHRRGLPRAWM